MQHSWLTFVAAAGIMAASPARAQDVRTPRVEIGGAFSAIVPMVFTDGPRIVPGIGPRATLNLTPRFAVEAGADVLAGLDSSGTGGLYQTQLKFPLREARAGRALVSFTVGAAGLASYTRIRETRVRRLDGSIAVYPGYRRFRARAPDTLTVGLAREEVFSRSLSSCLTIQAYAGPFGGLALRGSAGVSFGIGGYR
jgi:hypothetical protein